MTYEIRPHASVKIADRSQRVSYPCICLDETVGSAYPIHMAVPALHPKLPKYKPEIFASYRKVVLEYLQEKGMIASVRHGNELVMSGGYVRLVHPEAPVAVWVYRNYVRVFRKTGGKKSDTCWFTVVDVRHIIREVEKYIQPQHP